MSPDAHGLQFDDSASMPAVDQRSTWTTGAAPSGLLTSSWETVCISYDDFLVFFFLR